MRDVVGSKDDKNHVLDGLKPCSTESDGSDSTVMKIAGLYDDWTDSQGQSKRTYTTLTCASCSGFQWLHTRQPVFLTDDLVDEWLDHKVCVCFTCQRMVYSVAITRISRNFMFSSYPCNLLCSHFPSFRSNSTPFFFMLTF